MLTVKDISDYINEIAPYETKCSWDNCGILVGNSLADVKKIGFTLDLTKETFDEALQNGCDLIITHHPAIFHAKKSFLSDDVVFLCAQKGISVISAHTCFDCADGGVNDVLCCLLGLSDVKGVSSEECAVPMARIGKVKTVKANEFASYVSEKLKTTVRFVNANNDVNYVAVCGGAGMSFLDDVKLAGADVYVTGDISHHEMLEAKEKGISVIAAGHYETEYPAMEFLRKKVEKKFKEVQTVLISQMNPVEFIS